MIAQQSRIEEIIQQRDTGTIFSIYDFVTLGSYEGAKKALLRIEKEGKLERIMNGLYFKTGDLYTHPDMDATADAVARKFGWTVCPSGERCLYLLGLAETPETGNTYLSSGPYRTYTVYGAPLVFIHTTPRDIAQLSPKSALVVQALKELGKTNVTDEILRAISLTLTKEEKTALLKETTGSTSWVYHEIVKMKGMYPYIL